MGDSRQAAPYLAVWDAFRAASTTADGRHDTDDWRSRAGPYAIAIVRVAPAELDRRLEDFRRSLAEIHGVRLHPVDFLHITLQELGFVVDEPARPDEIGPERLEEFAQGAVVGVVGLESFAIELKSANSFQDAVFLETHDRGELVRIHEQLNDLAAILRPSSFPYLPHCTLAHYVESVPTLNAVRVIDRWRGTSFGSMAISEIEIVTLDPGVPYPPLRSYAVIPLGS